MKTLRRLSRLFFPRGDLQVKPVNGGGAAPEQKHVTEPVNRPESRTQDGWPLGERQFPTRTWQMIIYLTSHRPGDAPGSVQL